jgi:RNA-directed DNA polymerase
MHRTLEHFDLQKLAAILGISLPDLLDLSNSAPKQYYEKTLVKQDKVRVIEIPSADLKGKQRILLRQVLSDLPVHPRLYGCPRTSIKDAVADHISKPVVITLDIKDFFPSVRNYQLKSVLRRRKASVELAETLVRLTTYKNHLPHGSPTSPCLARLILNPLAANLERLLISIHPDAAFSIYVDDITLSGPEGIVRAIPTITGLVQKYGFSLNSKKIRVMRQDQEQSSLSIRLNNRIEPTSSYLRKLEATKEQYSSSHPRIKGMQAFIEFLFRTEN